MLGLVVVEEGTEDVDAGDPGMLLTELDLRTSDDGVTTTGAVAAGTTGEPDDARLVLGAFTTISRAGAAVVVVAGLTVVVGAIVEVVDVVVVTTGCR